MKPNQMNIHKNARLTYARRLEMVQDMTARGVAAPEAAQQYGVTPPTARKWLGRYLALGDAQRSCDPCLREALATQLDDG